MLGREAIQQCGCGVLVYRSVESPYMAKQPAPVTICTVCCRAGYNSIIVGTLCGRSYDGKRCGGVISSAIQEKVWAECPSCQAEGWIGRNSCAECDGTGWSYMRGRRAPN